MFPWARFRKSKAAVKLQTLLDLRGNIPSFIHISHGKLHVTRVRRFAIGILKSFQTTESIAQMMRKLCFCTRRVFDYLRMTKNSAPGPRAT